MNVFGVIVIVSCALSPILAQTNETFPGLCPSTVVTKQINETAFAGRWYEIKRFNNILVTGQCGLPNYVLRTNGGFNVTFLTTNLADKVNSSIPLELRRTIPVAASTPGNYDVYVNNIKNSIGQRVVETDYDSYSIVYGCAYNSTSNTNIQRLSIYSRNNTLNATTTAKVMQILKTAGINNATLQNVEQDNKKCGRGSATALVFPTIFSGIVALVLARKF